MKKAFFKMIPFSLMLVGCAAAPKTPDEFRSAVASGAMAHAHESFTVDRSSSVVAKAFVERADTCLNSAVNRTSNWKINGVNTTSSMDMIWNPTVKTHEDHAELIVQMELAGDVMTLQEPPEGGFYIFIADVSPIGTKESKVDAFYSEIRAQELLVAVKGWASGDDMSCPDLVKDAR